MSPFIKKVSCSMTTDRTSLFYDGNDDNDIKKIKFLFKHIFKTKMIRECIYESIWRGFMNQFKSTPALRIRNAKIYNGTHRVYNFIFYNQIFLKLIAIKKSSSNSTFVKILPRKLQNKKFLKRAFHGHKHKTQSPKTLISITI